MNATGPETRPSLVVRLQSSDDEQAWGRFVEVYEPLILRIVRSRGLQEADAREVAQEVLLAVSQAISRWEFDRQRGSFRGWLATITRNLVVNFLIRQARHPRASGDSRVRIHLETAPVCDGQVAQWYDREERLQLIRWAARQVRSEFRETTWLAFWETAIEGREAASVASQLGVSVGAVYVSRGRVMKRLRERVREMRPDDA